MANLIISGFDDAQPIAIDPVWIEASFDVPKLLGGSIKPYATAALAWNEPVPGNAAIGLAPGGVGLAHLDCCDFAGSAPPVSEVNAFGAAADVPHDPPLADSQLAVGAMPALSGSAGDDRLDGGVGPDSMAGGAGNDTYVVDDAGDVVWEAPDDLTAVDTTVVSVTADGEQGNWASRNAQISADGRYVVFESYAGNLVPWDTDPGVYWPSGKDIFVKDLQTGTLQGASTNVWGIPANSLSVDAEISAGGDFVIFESPANNLVPGDTNYFDSTDRGVDIFVKNLATGSIERVSVTADGTQASLHSELGGSQLSPDGRYVLFSSSATNLVPKGSPLTTWDIFLKDIQTGAVQLVSTNAAGVRANGDSFGPSISADNRIVTFRSTATHLVAEDSDNDWDIYVKDLNTGSAEPIATNAAGVRGNRNTAEAQISADGRYVVFASEASNLVFGDTNNASDVFVKDLQTGDIERVSTDAAGVQADGGSGGAKISADNRFVLFTSVATNLVPGDTNGESDVFVRDLQSGAIARVSLDASGMQSSGGSDEADISADGRYIVFHFQSWDANLVTGYRANANDVFRVRNPLAGGIDSVESSIAYTLPDNVENLALTGSGAISATGNTLNNSLVGNGADNVLRGGAGNDTLSGGAGVDTLFGDSGNDRYSVDNALDVVTETSAAAGEFDTVVSSVSWSLGANLERLILVDGAAIDGTGNGQDNMLTGNASANRLAGDAGHDTLDGGGGADTLVGGAGKDLYIVDSALDVIAETSTLASEIDTVRSAVAYTLGANLEILKLSGTAAIAAVGNGSGNRLVGNIGDNLLDGRLGNDTMRGGAGNDTYVVDSAGDFIIESYDYGISGAIDTVRSSVSYKLRQNVENLTLVGTADLYGSGNQYGNVLIGNAGNNLLNGLAGDDTMAGGAGNDTLVGGGGDDKLAGGAGNDIYEVNTRGDVVTEEVGAGTDLVRSYVSHTLAANFEVLTLLGTANFSGAGNAIANVINGNSGNNTLNGQGGNDTMIGGAGNDIYIVDASGDVVTENSAEGTDLVRSAVAHTLANNVENLTLLGAGNLAGTGNALDNVLIGNRGINVLNGRAGSDTMLGGAGNDTYIVDVSADAVTESLDAGIDLVRTYVDLSLSENVENLILLGTANINGTGNSLDNVIVGNAGNNVLNGLRGNDTMRGGAGNDTYVVNAAGDAISENADGGTDSVRSYVRRTLGDNVENLMLLGPADLSGHGNSLDNLLTGNTGNNLLDGGSGDDTLVGGAGSDTLIGGAGSDIFRFSAPLNDAVEIDTIGNYTSGSDSIELENAVFTSLTTTGSLSAGEFRSSAGSTTAADGDDHVIYDSASGVLYYDADAVGGVAALPIAIFTPGLALTSGDFIVL